MTYYQKFTWTAFTEHDLINGRAGMSSIDIGSTFEMAAHPTVTLGVCDGDHYLSGDYHDRATDHYQRASVNGHDIPHRDMYVEKVFTAVGSDGKTYHLAEIEIEHYDAPGTGDDFFSFVGEVPCAGVTLTITDCQDVAGHGINYARFSATAPAKVDPDPEVCVLTFDDLHRGDVVSDQYADMGIHIEAQRHGQTFGHSPNDAMIFDTNNPTGHDWDLSYEGRGNALIISEDNDSHDPDDNAGGGYIKFNFDHPTDILSIVVLDAETGGTIYTRTESGAWEQTHIPNGHNNDAQTIHINKDDVVEMYVQLCGSGAIDDLKFIKPKEEPAVGTITGTVFCDTDCDGLQTKVTVEAGCDYTIEAEDMHAWGFHDRSASHASGHEIARLSHFGGHGDLCTHFDGKDGVYDISLFIQDENDGHSVVKFRVNGEEIQTIILNRDSDGGGSDDGTFSEFVIPGVELKDGDQINIWAEGDNCELVRIDKIDLRGRETTTTIAEPVKEGVLVKLLNADGTPVLDDQGNEVTTLTDANGQYSFENVPVGEYKIMGVAPDGTEFTFQDVGNDDSIDSDVDGTGTSDVLTVTKNGTTDIDLGLKEMKDPGTASIAGRLFMDSDGDDLDVGEAEAGVAGVEVTLVDGSGNVVGTTTTGDDGSYAFTDLGAGDYRVVFPTDVDGKALVTANVGDDDTIDSDAGPDGQTDVISLGVGETVANVDAGVADPGTASLGGRVFIDSDDDDLDVGEAEAGVGGVAVTLVDGDGNELATTTTADDGSYLFEDLDAGDYRVVFPTDVDGLTLVDPNAGDDDTIDSDAAQDTGVSDTVSVGIGEDIRDVDAGVADPGTASLAGRVFVDGNDNDVDDDEPGLGGVTIVLQDGDGNEVATTTTADDGSYIFEDLDAGDYVVVFPTETADGRVLVGQDVGDDDTVDSDADPVTGATAPVTLGIGDTVEDVDAGVEDPGTASLGGRVFIDSNDDDQDDNNGDEAGVGDVTVTLVDADGNEVATQQTGDDGSYLFEDLDAGDYRVIFPTEVDGRVLVGQDVGPDVSDSDAAQGNGATDLVSVGIGEDIRDVDAGVEDPGAGAIRGRLFMDSDGDDLDVGEAEAGVAGVEVTLVDGSGNVVGTTTTGDDGSYAFTDLGAGDYRVVFPTDVDGKALVTANVGDDDTIDSDAGPDGQTDVISLGVGETVANVDAGVADPGTASLGGRVFIDSDDDDLDVGEAEAGVGGVAVTLVDGDGNELATTTTADDGSYLFEDLDAGDYRVVFPTDVDGLTLVDPNAGDDDTIDSDAAQDTGVSDTVSVGIGEDIRDVDAGVADPGTASLAGRVFVDGNDNDVDDDEPGLGGVTIVLQDGDGNEVATTTTADDGSYIFEDLDAGDYVVVFPTETADGRVLVGQDVGDDDTVDSDADPVTGATAPVTLGIGDTVEDVDAGVEDPGTASLGGRVFIDSNDDDQDDNNGDEAGVGDVTVTLVDADGNEVATQQTGDDGSYLFEDLDAGDYRVIFPTEVDGRVLVGQDVGPDVSDSDAAQGNGATDLVSVGIGEDIRDVDAGVEDPGAGAIRGRLFMDSDGDDLDVGEAEAGVAGVEVTLVDGSGNVVGTTTTGDDGSYAFTDLGAGDYRVVFPTDVDGKALVTANVGDDDTIDSDAGPDGQTDVISLGVGETVANVDAGVADPGTASLGGRVFIDSDDDDLDVGEAEAGVGGVAVTLVDGDGNELATTTTADDGSYLFEDLDAGDYRVVFPTDVDGLTLVDPNAGDDDTIDSDAAQDTGVSDTVSVGIGEDIRDVDAGVADPGTASLAGRVFVDGNDNDVDDDEPGLGGVTIVLQDGDGNEVATTTTADDGSYIFEDLDAGDYVVVFPTETADGRVLVGQDVGDDDTVDSDADPVTGATAPVTLGIGDTVEDVDAGVEDPGTASLGGRVFIDSNDDDQDDNNGDEAGVGDVTVTLVDADGNEVATQQTGDDGSYLFEDLDAGDYRVIFPTEVDGRVLVGQDVGPDVSDSDAAQGNGATDLVSVGIGEDIRDVDAGVEDPGAGAIRGRLFMDSDGDDLDVGEAEAGVAGVEVTLVDGSGNVVGTTTTGDDGSYAFTDLGAGDYRVVFPTDVDGKALVTANVGDDDTIDSDAGPDGQTDVISLGVGETVANVDAGVADPGTASLGGRVFIDSDDDDLDVGEAEAGVGGVAVTLVDGDGNELATTTTADDGSYLFEDLDAGDYRVVFPTDVDGLTLVDPNAGDDDTIDSDAAQDTGVSDTVSVGIGEDIRDVDAGVADPGTASLAGRVFVDGNDNDVDDDEPGLGGVTIVLQDGDGNEVATTTTADDGSYIFEDLDAGDYVVVFPTETADGRVLVGQDVGDDDTVDSDADPVTGATAPVTLGIGDTVEDVDAGVEDPGTASLGGRVFIDSNDDDQDDNNGDEAGVGDVTVTLVDADGNEVATQQTGDDGSYLFEDLDAGDYRVIFPTEVDGRVLVGQDVGPDVSDSDAAQGNGATDLVSVGIGEDIRDVDAGVEDPGAGAIRGRLFMDSDGDDLDVGEAEAGVAGVEVTLVDGSGNVVGTTTTGDDGSYAFTDLGAGDYRVVFPTDVDGKALVTANVGDDDTIDSDAGPDGQTDVISLGVGETVANVDAGVADPGTASLGGRVFIDSDDDDLDVGEAEAGVGGVAVTLVDADGNELATTTTADDGSYLFEDLDAGDYRVVFPTDVDGLTLVDPNAGDDDTIDSDAAQDTGVSDTVSVGIGEDIRDVDAGVADPGTASLAGRVFVDGNDNDVDDDEPGLGGVTIVLQDGDGNEVATTTTADDGSYIFEDLDAGDYVVVFPTETADGRVLVGQDVGDDDTVDSDADPVTGATAPVTLGIGDTVEDVDAGVEDPGTASLGGRVFIDSNDDDQDDNNGDEAGVGDVTVTLVDADGNEVATQQTGDDGSYLFEDLDAGDYRVIFPTEVDGRVLVGQDVGPDVSDSDAAQGNGATDLVSVGIGEDIRDVDAGVEDPGAGAIRGRLFMDSDGDDLDVGEAEAGVAGVEVTLVDGSGNVVGTTTTGDDGSYAFTDLGAGDYRVVFPTDVDGKALVTANVGDDDTIDSDAGPDGQTDVISLGVGETVANVDAGVADPGTASLGGRVFIDSDDDDLDVGEAEAGVGGVAVTLVDGDGNELATTTTADDGSYLFEDLDAGDYRVVFPTDVDGLTLVDPNAGDDDTIDSDAAQDTGVSDTVSVGIGEDIRDVDAGVADPGTASLAGRVFVDGNDNDVDDDEPGLGGVTIVLQDGDGNEVATTTTADDGSYIFEDLDAGDYVVVFPTETADGRVLVGQDVGDDDTVDSDADPVTGATAPVTLGIGDTVEDVDAGVEDPGTASLGGRVFIDSNDDDQDDNNGDEAGVGDVTVTLVDADGNEVATQQTGDDGSYLFEDLDAGDYRVIFPTEVDGRVLVGQDVGPDVSDSDAAQGNGATDLVSVGIGEDIRDVDAGVEDPGAGAIRGRLFMDSDGDDLDVGEAEAGVAGVEVTLVDGSGNVVGTTTTGDDGSYAFTDLGAGDYRVVFPTDVDGKALVTANVGDDDTIDSDAGPDGQTDVISLGVGETVANVDAGVADPGTASLGGRVFIDSDDDDLDVGEAEAGVAMPTATDHAGVADPGTACALVSGVCSSTVMMTV